MAGDLDTILMVALRKEPDRRNASVDQFVGDIARCLVLLDRREEAVEILREAASEGGPEAAQAVDDARADLGIH